MVCIIWMYQSNKVIDGSLEIFWKIRSHNVNINAVQYPPDIDLLLSMEKFWKQEHISIIPAKDTAMSREDISALKKLEGCTKKVHNKYEVPMLWKEPDIVLPNNLHLAKRRFVHVR